MTLENVKYKKFIAPVVAGIVLWLMSPIKPDGVSLAAWHMLAIFVATIIGCITQPLPIGGIAVLGFSITVLSDAVPMEKAISGFGNSSIWLIVMAFFISRGFIKTGLGRRMAFHFVRMFGKKTLGLAYSLIGVDLILAPATPSNTARAGGIMYPIIESLANAFGSSPKDNTQNKIGSFLLYSEFQGNIITAAMFLTAMAGNPLAQSLAKPLGVHITWMNWFIGGLVPGLISLILVPLIIYKIYPPEIKATPDARKWATKQLNEMGSVSKAEKFMILTFLVALILWILGSFLGIDATLTAFIALSLLLVTGVLSWSDVTKETGAWNTLVWFSVLIMMAGQLNELGFIPWMSKAIGSSLHGLNWILVLVALIVAYFYSHYLFASATAHVSAMYGAFLAVAISAGVPPLLAALMLGFFGDLIGSTTHYGNGPAPILFGAGYVKQTDWWRMNAILGIFYLVVWIGVGSVWMKVMGMW